MVVEVVVRLAQGLWKDGVQHADAVVRPLTGADEAALVDLSGSASVAERVTALIAATVPRIGTVEPVRLADARRLTVGDRERLLLALYRVTFGPQMEAIARCPAAGCGTMMELELAVDDLLARHGGADGSGPEHDVDVVAGPARTVRFRLPTGEDQEHAARRASLAPAEAGDAILRRTIVSVRDAAGRDVPIESVATELRRPLADAFVRLDRLVDTRVDLACPTCGAATSAPLDAASFVLREVDRAESIFVEVDRIARRYHWSEAEILALPVTRRRRYLALIAEAEEARA